MFLSRGSYIHTLSALGIFLAVIGIGYFTYTQYQNVKMVRDREASERVRLALAQKKRAADAERLAWLNAKMTIRLNNPTGGTATLQTAIPAGSNADGSTQFQYNQACSALPHQTCYVEIYEHRDVSVRAVTSYVFLAPATSPWEKVSALTTPAVISAWRSDSDQNCCYLANP